jgi:hypothetical protein
VVANFRLLDGRFWWVDQCLHAIIGDHRAEEQLGGALRPPAVQLAARGCGAQIIGQAIAGRARPLGVEDRAKLGRSRRFGDDEAQQRHDLALRHQPQQAASELEQHAPWRRLARQCALGAGNLRGPAADDLGEQRLLAGEMPVERLLRRAGARGDRLHRAVGEAMYEEHFLGDAHQLLAPFPAARNAPDGGSLASHFDLSPIRSRESH